MAGAREKANGCKSAGVEYKNVEPIVGSVNGCKGGLKGTQGVACMHIY
jgi:hypothetical protein